MTNKITDPKKIYFIGIKGVGMTMLAQFLKKQGHDVSGSDVKDVFLTDKVLRQAKIPIRSPFSERNVLRQADIIVYSSAFNDKNNVELALIKNRADLFSGSRVLSYAELLGQIFNQYRGVAVCGSHGKTTVTAGLGYILARAGFKPNVLVGSNVPQFPGSSLNGQSKYLVAEVDEYQNKLQYFQPRGVILNNIDYDHPDFFPTPASYYRVFYNFLKKIPPSGWLVVNADDQQARRAAKYALGKIISYVLDDGETKRSKIKADYRAYDVRQQGGRQIFTLDYQGRRQGDFSLSLFGRHSILNALAIIAAARQLRVSWVEIKKHLATFTGLDRRAQLLGRYRGALIIDDYAHHPTEVKTTLTGLCTRWPKKRLITVFHPHTFSRTKALFSEFVKSFTEVDELIILDIYGSAREQRGGVSSGQLVQAIKKFNRQAGRQQKVVNIKSLAQATTFLRSYLRAGDLLVLMGAGDVFRIGEQLLAKTAGSPTRFKLKRK